MPLKCFNYKKMSFLTWPGLYKLRYYHAIFEFMVGSLSFIINFLLIYLALYKSTIYMKIYKKMLILNCCVDLIYNSIFMVTQVSVDMKNGGMFFMNGYFLEQVPQPYAIQLQMFWLWGLFLSVANIPGQLCLQFVLSTVLVQFLFRYCILCRNRVLTTKELLIIMGILSIIIGVHCWYGTIAWYVTDERRKELLPILTKDPLWNKDPPVFSQGYVTNIPSVFHFFCSQVLVILAYICIMVTRMKIQQKLKATRAIMSTKTLQAQAQLNRILLIEVGFI